MTTDTDTSATPSSTVVVVLAWLAVGLPLAWGVSQTFAKAMVLFN